MKIAIISDWCYPYSKGGSEVRYYYLAKELINNGHSVTWFTLKNWEEKNDTIEIDKITYQSIGKKVNAYNKEGIRSAFQSIYFGWRVLIKLNFFKTFDVIDTPQYPFFHIIPLMWYRKKTVVTWFEYWGKHWFNYTSNYLLAFIGVFVEKTISRIPKRVISISNQSYTRLKYNTRNKSNTSYIPNWINYSKLSKIKSKSDKYDVCYFGRLKNHKNVDLLIRAIKLCVNMNNDLSVKIFGDGPERNNLENLVEELKLKSNIKFEGFIDSHEELLREVSASNLFVHPSTKEGGGSIVTLEANAVGVPVLAIKSDLGIDKSLIYDNQNGFWVEDCSSQALAKKILEAYNFVKKHREQFYNDCRKFVSKYDIHILGKQVELIYNRGKNNE